MLGDPTIENRTSCGFCGYELLYSLSPTGTLDLEISTLRSRITHKHKNPFQIRKYVRKPRPRTRDRPRKGKQIRAASRIPSMSRMAAYSTAAGERCVTPLRVVRHPFKPYHMRMVARDRQLDLSFALTGPSWHTQPTGDTQRLQRVAPLRKSRPLMPLRIFMNTRMGLCQWH